MKHIGKYAVIRKLGESATATVYLARDPFAERDVAVKAIEPAAFTSGSHDPEAARKLFVTEAALAGKLVHPHIVQIYDAVADGDPSYIVMEYVAGGTLEPCTHPDQLLAPADAIEIIFKCARALDFAQRAGIIHRAIKPANILRCAADGATTDVKVSDFGASLSMAADPSRMSGLAYMSPQQVMEQTLNHQADIWSLGVVMYQLLTGQLPFPGKTPDEIVSGICNTDPPPPSQLRSELSADLDAIVAHALHKSLEQRYASWDEFSFALADVFGNEHFTALRAARIGDAEKFALLRKLSFFQGFADADLWEVLRMTEWQRFAQGDVLMRKGEQDASFCVLAAGEIKVTKQGKLLNVLSAGECFGEMAYLTPEQSARTAEITALRPAIVVKIGTDILARASQPTRHGFDRALLHILVERLDLANTRLTSAVL